MPFLDALYGILAFIPAKLVLNKVFWLEVVIRNGQVNVQRAE